MKFCCCWLGLAFFTLGFISFLASIGVVPVGSLLGPVKSVSLAIIGGFFIYYGREFLPLWLSYLLDSDE